MEAAAASLRAAEQSFAGVEALLAEYAPVACVKPGVVVRALCRSTAAHVFLKMIGDSCPCTICPAVPDEVAVTFGLQGCPDPEVRSGFVRPLGWFRAGIAFHRTRPAFVPTRVRNVVLVLQDEGVCLAPLMLTYPYPVDVYRVRWLISRLVRLLVTAYTTVGFTHHDLHSGNLVLGPASEGSPCCADGAVRLVDFGTSDALGLRGGRPMAKAAVKRLRFDLRCVGVVLFQAAAKYSQQPRHEKDPSALHQQLFAGDAALLGSFCDTLQCAEDPEGQHAGHFLQAILELNDGSGDADVSDCQRLLSHPFLQPPGPSHHHAHPTLFDHRLACLAEEAAEEALSTSICLEQCLDVERDEAEGRLAVAAEEEASWATLADGCAWFTGDLAFGLAALPSSSSRSTPAHCVEPASPLSHAGRKPVALTPSPAVCPPRLNSSAGASPGEGPPSPVPHNLGRLPGVGDPGPPPGENIGLPGIDTSTMSSVSTHPCLSPRQTPTDRSPFRPPDDSPPLARRPKRRRLTGNGSLLLAGGTVRQTPGDPTPLRSPSSAPLRPPRPTPPATPSSAPPATPSSAPPATPSSAPPATPSSAPPATPSSAPPATPSSVPLPTPSPPHPRLASPRPRPSSPGEHLAPTTPTRSPVPAAGASRDIPPAEAQAAAAPPLELSGLPACVTRLLTSADGDMPTLTDLEVSCCTEPSLLTLNLPPSPRAQNRLWKKYRSALRRLDLGKQEDQPDMCRRIRQYFEVIDEVDL